VVKLLIVAGYLVYIASVTAAGYLARRKAYEPIMGLLTGAVLGPLAVLFIACLPARPDRAQTSTVAGADSPRWSQRHRPGA
jgi:hypothetical protein